MFQKASFPFNESERAQEVDNLSVLFTDQAETYNDFVELAAEISGCTLSFVNLLNRDIQWSLTCAGMEDTEFNKMRKIPRSDSFCQYALLSNKPLLIEDTTTSKIFSKHPFVLNEPNIRFYAGFPLISTNGNILGTLCLIDFVPKTINQEISSILVKVARRVTSSLQINAKNINQYALKIINLLEDINKIKCGLDLKSTIQVITYLITSHISCLWKGS